MPIQLPITDDLLGTVVNEFKNNSLLQFVDFTYDSGNLIITQFNGNQIIVALPVPASGGVVNSPIGSLTLGTTSGIYNVLSVTPVDYLYNGVAYFINTTTTLNLSIGDPSNDRIDAVYIDTNDNTIKVLNGTPGNPPVLPSLLSTQILVGAVYVKANASPTTQNFYTVIYSAFSSQQVSDAINNGTPISKLVDLTDVNISSPANNDVVIWNSSISKFITMPFPVQVNQTTAGSGLTEIASVISLGGILLNDTNLDINTFNLTISNGTNSLANFLTGELFDNFNILSVDYNDRLIYDGLANLSIDYDSRILRNSNTLISYDWDTYTMYDSGQILSIDHSGRNLYSAGAGAIHSIDYQNRNLYSTSGSIILNYSSSSSGINYLADYSANYTDRSLVDRGYVLGLSGTNGSGILLDSLGILSINYFNRELFYDDGITPSIKWNMSLLVDNSGNSVVDWNSKYLMDSSGIASVDWQGKGLYDNGNIQSILWDNRILIDNSSRISVNYNSRALYNTTGNIIFDWNSQYLIDNSGVASVDWGGKGLYDNGNIQSILWDNRILIDSSGRRSILYNTRELYDTTGDVTIQWEDSILVNSGSTYGTWENSTSGNSIVIKSDLDSKLNSLHGDKTLSASSTTTVTVTFGVTLSNTNYFVAITPGNLLSAAPLYVNNFTTTTFDVVYVSSILTGTIDFRWSIND